MSATTPAPESNLVAAPAEVRAETEQAPHPVFAAPPRHRSAPLVLGVIGIAVATIALLAVGALFLVWLGPGATAFAAVLALIPLVRSDFFGPMAVAMMGGIVVATVLTLVFLPALYATWFRVPKPMSSRPMVAPAPS